MPSGHRQDSQLPRTLQLIDRHERLHSTVLTMLPQAPRSQSFTTRRPAAHPLNLAAFRTWRRQQRGLLRASTSNTERVARTFSSSLTDSAGGQTCLRHGCGIHRGRRTADILVSKHMPCWGYPVGNLMDKDLQLCPKLSAAIFKRLSVRKISTSAYRPNSIGGIKRVNNAIA